MLQLPQSSSAPALLCVLHLSHHLLYPQPLPTRTILTGTGSQPPKEAAPNDAGRLNFRRRAHHQGKQPPCLSRTRAQSQGMGRCKEQAARPEQQNRKAQQQKGAELALSTTAAESLVLFHSFPAVLPAIGTCQ